MADDKIPLNQEDVLRLLAMSVQRGTVIHGIEIARQWMDKAAQRIADLEREKQAVDDLLTASDDFLAAAQEHIGKQDAVLSAAEARIADRDATIAELVSLLKESWATGTIRDRDGEPEWKMEEGSSDMPDWIAIARERAAKKGGGG